MYISGLLAVIRADIRASEKRMMAHVNEQMEILKTFCQNAQVVASGAACRKRPTKGGGQEVHKNIRVSYTRGFTVYMVNAVKSIRWHWTFDIVRKGIKPPLL